MDSAKRSNRSIKRKLEISSDSDEDIKKPTVTDVKTPRHSSRIHDKQQRPEFRLPSRDDVWKDIPSMISIPKLKNLTPKKTVNNFTKVYNNYNYDDYEDTSDDESSSVESSDSGDQKESLHRIKNYHKRLLVQSSSSDEDDDRLAICNKASVQTSNVLPKEQDSTRTTEVADEPCRGHSCEDMKNRSSPGETVPVTNADLGDSDDSGALSPCKRNGNFRNRSILESDNESSKNDSDDDTTGSDSENSNTSHLSDSIDLPTESSRCRLAKQKMKQINMFKKFREAQAKRRKSST